MMQQVLTADRIFDGQRLHRDHAVVVERGRVVALLPLTAAPAVTRRLAGLLAPALVDLQVNGGGGHQVGPGTGVAQLRQLCTAHRALGSGGVLPTLITDRPEVTAQVIAAGIAAAAAGVPGFLGLHLEGPHLDPRRKGAHDPALIRPMGDEDLDRLCAAAAQLPALMVTLAPEAASPEQIARLAQAGVVVSLGHSDCSYETAQAAFRAGARCATHLFNAMSPLGHRAPGLVGAVLGDTVAAGLIADGIHVHPGALQVALAARPEGLFLVSDCMAFAGTDLQEMPLNNRQVLRRDGRLTLADGTLAGADLTLDRAAGNLVRLTGIPVARALAMATSVPAALIGRGDLGRVAPGTVAEFILLDEDLALSEVLF